MCKSKRVLVQKAIVYSLVIFVVTSSVFGQAAEKKKEKYVWKTVSGKVVDEAGQPVKDAFVCHGSISANPMNHTSTNEKGEFKLKYRELNKELERGWLWAYSPDHNLHCVSNSRTDDHLLELPKYTEFKITFSQPDGKPLKHASIRPCRHYVPNGKYSDAESKPRLGGIIPMVVTEKLATTTDENGQCVIRNIPRALWGPVVIESKKHGKHRLGGGTKRNSFKLAHTGSLKIEILPDEPVEFHGTKVTVMGWSKGGETNLSGKIGELGICKFEHVIPGEIEIRLKIGKDEVYQPQLKKKYMIHEDLENHVEIPIKKTVEVQGKVLAGGKPISNAILRIGELRSLVRTDEGGQYKARVFPGDVSIRVYDMPSELYADFESGQSHRFSVKDGDAPVTLKPIEIRALTSVPVKVIDENDKPVTGFIVGSVYKGRGYGPFARPKLNDKGILIAKIGVRGMRSLDEASYFLKRQSDKHGKEDQNEKSEKIELTLESEDIVALRSGEPLVLRCKRADIEKH